MKTPISTEAAPKAIGPYSQAIAAQGGRTLYLSGQTPIDPATGKLVPGTIEDQTVRVMENLKAVLAAAGASFDQVVRMGVFLTDLGEFAKMNEVYGRYIPGVKPARTTVQVAALPLGAKVEIDAIAVVD